MYVLRKMMEHLGLGSEETGGELPEKYLEKAQTLLEKYGEALQVEGSDILPESLLPDSKKALATAIKLHLALLPQDNEKQRDKLKCAYAYLATFVPDEEALRFSQGDQAVGERCAAEQEKLRLEIDVFCADLPKPDDLLKQ